MNTNNLTYQASAKVGALNLSQAVIDECLRFTVEYVRYENVAGVYLKRLPCAEGISVIYLSTSPFLNTIYIVTTEEGQDLAARVGLQPRSIERYE